MEPENKSLEKESPFGNHVFQVPHENFGGVIFEDFPIDPHPTNFIQDGSEPNLSESSDLSNPKNPRSMKAREHD